MTHRPSSLAGRLMAFFDANPNEELTPAQIGEKFGAAPSTVAMAISRLGRHIENVRVVRLPAIGIQRDTESSEH